MKTNRKIIFITALITALLMLSSCAGEDIGIATGTPTASVGTSETAASITEPGETQTEALRVGVQGVAFDDSSLILKSGNSCAVEAKVLPENATNRKISYSVSDSSVISYVDGVLTALSEGTAQLIAESDEDGYIARLKVIVSNEAQPTSDTPDPTTTTPVEPSTEPTVVPISSDPPVTTTTTPVDLKVVTVPGSTVRHIFTHCLIIDPAKGCGNPNVYPYGPLDVDCLTVSEFKALLESLYERDYCLININDMYVLDENGRAKLSDAVRIYEGKKPLVISIDDVTYDPRKKDSGMISRLVVDKNGQIAGEIDNPDGSKTLNYEECFCLLEEFLETHPDFSFEGNKFTLALTGFAGILGYRTDEQTANAEYRDKYNIPAGTDYQVEREKAQKVVDWFKDHGYNFASHTYSHSNYTTCSLERVQNDIDKWNRNIKPLIGETKILIYPYGAFTYADTEKHQKLLNEGFVVFCGTSQLNTLWDNAQPKSGGGAAKNTGTIYLERFTVTGFTLRNYASKINYFNYYYDYYKELGNDSETAKAKAQSAVDSSFEISRKNSLEYYVPEEIYDHEHRYYQLLTE